MTVQDLEALYDYNYWANRKLFHVLSHQTREEFVKPVAGSYESVRNTLVHVLSAEWGWLDRCGGHPRGAKLKGDDYPTLESLVTTWSKVEGYVREFLSTLKDEDLKREVEYSPDGVARRAMRQLSHAPAHLHEGGSATRPLVRDPAPRPFRSLRCPECLHLVS